MTGAVFLADTSVFVLQQRRVEVRRLFDTYISQSRLAACQMTALEWLNNAPSPSGYAELRRSIYGIRWIDVTTAAMNRAVEVHAELGTRSQHREFSLSDLVIAATAELAGATVLHYDHDYDRIAEITGQSTEWIVPRGSL